MDRREFLATGAGLLVVGVIWRPAEASQAAATEPGVGLAPARPVLNAEELDTWLTMAADGRVTIYTGRIDMGTGVATAFAQVIADELEVPLESVTIVMGDTGLTPDQGKSTASSNMSRGLLPLRSAAAEARHLLVELAADRLRTPVSGLIVHDGVVQVAAEPTRRVTYERSSRGAASTAG